MPPDSPAVLGLHTPTVLRLVRLWSAIVFLGIAPLASMIWLVVMAGIKSRGFVDFETFWHAGHLVAHGASPYPAVASLPATADRATFEPFVYPPPAAFIMVPLSLLPFTVANVVFSLIGAAAVVLSLRILGVKDWRCYGVAFWSTPVLAAGLDGAISLLLLLGVAAAWRYRRHTTVVSSLLASVVALKLFLWPMWFWLVGTRRYRAAALSIAIAVAATIGSWALLGFAGMREYPHLLSDLTKLVGPKSYSLYALARAAGASSLSAYLFLFVSGTGLFLIVRAATRCVDPDKRAFVGAIAASLFLTPILWPHYFVLLFVPLALASRRLSGLWLLPLAFWFDSDAWSYGRPAQILPAILLTLAIMILPFQRRTSYPSFARTNTPTWASE